MVYEGHHIERAPDRTGAGRNAIVFDFRPLEAIEEVLEAEGPPTGATLQGLRQRAVTAALGASQSLTQGVRNVYQRNRDVRTTSWHGLKEAVRAALRRQHFYEKTARRNLSHTTCAASAMVAQTIWHT